MYKATLSDPQNKELLIEYKKNNNSLNSQLKNTEILYYSNELDINKHDASSASCCLLDYTDKPDC